MERKCKLFYEMAGFRAYYENCKKAVVGDKIILAADESRHLCGSLRATEGDAADVFDLFGNVFACKITKADQKKAELEIVESVEKRGPATKIYIAQCLPKGKVFDDIIRQSVEIGAAGVFPLLSERSQIRLDEKDAAKKAEKWRTHVIEAVKQSANFFSFEIACAQNLREFLNGARGFDLKIVASLQDKSVPILEALRTRGQGAKSVCILIGPEGDLSPEEYAEADKVGFVPCTLGRNVMKCDTAAASALAVCSAFAEAGAAIS